MPESIKKPVITIDLNFQGLPGAIASYLIPHRSGVVLIESGPGSTLPGLQAGLRANGYSVKDVTDVFLSHIHLDHAGASGWLARQGSTIHVHPVGAPHLLNPEKLISSASRLYGDQMETLWGEILAVPQDHLVTPPQDQTFEIEDLRFLAIDTKILWYYHFLYALKKQTFTICSAHFLIVATTDPAGI